MGLIFDLDSPSLVLTPRRKRSRRTEADKIPAASSPMEILPSNQAEHTRSGAANDALDIRPHLKYCCAYSEKDSRIARDTPILPHVVAEAVLDEACAFLKTDLPQEWVVQLASRAETVYRHNPRFRLLLRGPGNSGRDALWSFTRHWLASLLARNRPRLHAQLPDSYSMGRALPVPRPGFCFMHPLIMPVPSSKKRSRRNLSECHMSTVTIQMPESLEKQLRECAAKEGVTLDQLLSSAAAEKLSALMTLEHLRQRALHARREDFVAFLKGSPDVPPLPGDEI